MKQYTEKVTSADGSELTVYTLDNEHGLQITALDFGATLASVRHQVGGREDELLVGFSDFANHRQVGSFIGSTVGRVANRIKNGLIEIDGAEYTLTKNFGDHTLHGGEGNFSYRPWTGKIIEATDGAEAQTIRFTLESPHLDGGFPGVLSVVVEYTLTADNQLIMSHRAEADRDTVVNLTNHCYWNLAGVVIFPITIFRSMPIHICRPTMRGCRMGN